MAWERITTFYDQPQHRQTVTLDGTEYQIRLTYRRRLASWYMDLYDAEGTAIALGRRLSPGWSPINGVIAEGGPPGLFLVKGVDPYKRDEVELYYIPLAQIPAPAPSGELRVVLS